MDIPDKHLIPAANTGESKEGGCKEQPSSFKAANDIAMTELPPTHPVYLDLALNFTHACRLAKSTLDATAELDMLSEESYKDSTHHAVVM
ncbi:hypothetical protein E2I00_011649 [Balaenoptera physalus]|uniref:14-3-3 domain-containing protein n=1 Tax=Balaenoptera physalus TaxID=9770 RepID=A0A6A1QEC6_BALPH|nr:hypothetical protein E2I00_011649 [Balaenoptera physalus]